MTSLAALDSALARCRADVRRLEKAARDLAAARQALAAEQATADRLARELAKEEWDAARLQPVGALLRRLYDKERREAAAAKLRHDAALRVVSDLAEEIARLEHEIAVLGDPEARLRVTLDEKERVLLARGDERSRRLLAAATRRADAEVDRRELAEAIEAGEDVLRDLTTLIEALNRASTLGTWDILGGGLFVTMVKHGYIDDARWVGALMQSKLLRFDRELADVASGTLPLGDVDLGAGLDFLDFFIDGLVIDAFVQSRITHARRSAEVTYAYVDQMVTWLHGLRDEADAALAAALAERAALLA